MNVAVITGASMGLGEEFARQLASRKINLLLTARSADRLNAIADELRKRHGISVEVCVADLAEPAAAGRIATFMKERSLTPTWLINNAGFGEIGQFDAMKLERVRGMMMVNMVSLVELTHVLLPQLRLSRDARIINVASTAAFQPVALFNIYAATKTFVLHFSEALAEELAGTDVKVLCLCPGPTPTNFAENARINPAVFEKGQSAADVVRMGIKASDSRRVVYVCQKLALVVLQRYAPRWVVRKAAAMIARSMVKSVQR